MKHVLGLIFTVAAFGQHYEIGADIGYGIYRNGSIISSTETARAGIRNRFAAGIRLGDDVTDYLSGEFRYLYHDGHPFLQAPGVKTDIQGQSQTLTLDLVVHLKKPDRRLRPFVGGGVGAKAYVIAGPAPFPQPAPQIATLSTNDVWKVVFDLGGGTQYLIHRHMLLRGEFRDYLTTFPRQQIVPAPHNTARGIFQQFTPLFGVSYYLLTFRSRIAPAPPVLSPPWH
jgi:opacity protein-like surface antigen